MDTTTLKRILLVYNFVLMIISGLAITLGVIMLIVSFFLPFNILPSSVAYSALAGGAILIVVGLVGFLEYWLKGTNEKKILPWYIAGLVVLIAIQVYVSFVMIVNDRGSSSVLSTLTSLLKNPTIYDPLGIVYNMVGGYTTFITGFGKLMAFFVLILTIPQIIAIYVAVQILTAKTSFLPSFPVIFHS